MNDGPVVDLLCVLDAPDGALQLLEPLVLCALEDLGAIVLIALVVAHVSLQEAFGTHSVVGVVGRVIRVVVVFRVILGLFLLRLLLLGIELLLLRAGALAVAASSEES